LIVATPTSSVDELCRQKGITFDELVGRCGLDRPRVMAIYLGRWTPSPSERDRMAAALGVTRDEITWGHKTPIQHIYGMGPM
jgi:transcriptional regulator with XRE-family HTH domain